MLRQRPELQTCVQWRRSNGLHLFSPRRPPSHLIIFLPSLKEAFSLHHEVADVFPLFRPSSFFSPSTEREMGPAAIGGYYLCQLSISLIDQWGLKVTAVAVTLILSANLTRS